MGVEPGIPIAAGAADTAAALLGSGLIDPGPVQLTVGTGGQIVAPLQRARPDSAERTHCFRAAAPERWYAMAAILNAGLALEWTLRVLGASWDDIYGEAFRVAAGSDGLTFLPYINGERTPLFDPSARGAWIGLRASHGRGHLLRSALEGVGFALRQALEALESTGIAASSLRLAGGGTLDPRWRRLLADILGRPLLPLAVSAASARGAALLAAVAAGALPSVRDCLALAPVTLDAIEPQADRGALESAYRRYTVLAGEAAMLSGDHEGGRARRGAAGRAPGGTHA
jgi:xylulokinase